jgi:hypothetical protein
MMHIWQETRSRRRDYRSSMAQEERTSGRNFEVLRGELAAEAKG